MTFDLKCTQNNVCLFIHVVYRDVCCVRRSIRTNCIAVLADDFPEVRQIDHLSCLKSRKQFKQIKELAVR